MTTLNYSQVLLVFGTGVLASLSPCVYPLLPITVGYMGSQAQGGRALSVVLFSVGQCIAMIALSLFVVMAGETLGFSSESRSVQIAMGVLLLGAGVFSFVGRLPSFFSRWNLASDAQTQKLAKLGFAKPLLLGAGSALIASPCTSPILAGVLALIAVGSTVFKGVVLMTAYSLGFSLLFLILGLGFVKMGSLPRAGRWMNWISKLSSAVLVGAGVYYLV